MNYLGVTLLSGLFFISSFAQSKTLLEICAERKLKEFRIKTLVTIADEPKYLEKFTKYCAKDTQMTTQEKQEQARQAAEKAAKDAKEKVTTPPKPAVVAAPPPAPKSTTAVAPPASASGSSEAVFGGCGTTEQCASIMRDARTPKYTWSSPGLQAYLGELWGNNFNQASGLGGTFEQPENPCNDSNQGQMIALDTGTDIVGVACMSSFATQEELKKMAEKIKNTKLDTLPQVVATKKAKYEWKIVKDPDPSYKDQICFCKGLGNQCEGTQIGVVINEHPCCNTWKCVRTDGGPVKPKVAATKPVDPKVAAIVAAVIVRTVTSAAAAAATAPVPATPTQTPTYVVPDGQDGP